jgi:hypothetical protein
MLNNLRERYLRGSSRGKMIIIATLVILIGLVLASVIYFFGVFNKIGKKSNIFDGFSKLVLSGANAQDNFDLEAVGADSLGIDVDTTFVLTSKDKVITNDVKKIIKISPEITYTLEEQAEKKWLIKPVEPLDPNTIIHVSMATVYLAAEGSEQSRSYDWAFQVKDSFKILNTIPRDTGVSVPVNSGVEVTFSHENFYDYEKYFSLEPKVDGRFEKHGRTLVFVPKDPLTAGQIYTVKVQKGLPLSDSKETLLEDYFFAFETIQKKFENQRSNNKNPWLYMHEKLQDFAISEPPVMFLTAMNIPQDTLEVSVYPLASQSEYIDILNKRDNYPWWSYSKDNYLVNLQGKNRLNSWQLKIENQDNSQFISFPQGLPRGYFVVEVKSGEIVDQIILQISDATAYVNVANDRTVVWVADLVNKKTVDGAQVELLGTQKKYTSDGNGVATFATPGELAKEAFDKKDNRRYYFKINFAEESLIMPASYLSAYYGSGEGGINANYWQYFYTDRPLYQPTDSIKFWGLLKLRNKQNSSTDQIKVQLYKAGYVDYYYRPVMISEQNLSVDSDGIYNGQIDFKDLRADYYYIQVKVGEKLVTTKYIQVRPYEKPAYSLTLTADKKADFAGNQIKLTGLATYFEGTPVPNLALIFNNGEGKQKVTTDNDGKVNLTYTIPYKDCTGDYACWPRSAWLQLSPESAELAEITADTSLLFYGPSVYVTQKVTYPEKGKSRLEIRTKKIDLNKAIAPYWWGYSDDKGTEIAPNTKIEAEVTKVTYKKIDVGTSYDFINKVSQKKYRYDREEKVVDNFTGFTDNNGLYVYERQVEPETSYIIKMKYFDNKSKYDIAVAYLYYGQGDRMYTYNSYDYNYYQLRLNKNSFSVGDNVVVDFLKNNEENLPNNDNNYYLYLQHQNGLRDYAVTKNSRYSFVFTEDDIPNINLTGVYFNGRAFLVSSGEAARLNKIDKTMSIKVKTDKDKYQPGEEVKIEVSTQNAKGQPVSAAVNLNLIDEAFYAVMDDQAHPVDSIYTDVGSGVLFASYAHRTASTEMFRSSNAGAEKGCFLAGTDILLADGTSKNIENIRIGDRVLTLADPRKNEKTVGTVTQIYQHTVNKYLVINNKLKITPEHLVYTNFSFRAASSLKIGDWLLTSENKLVFIQSIEVKDEVVEVYNFTVDPQHTYFADGIFVHNTTGAEKGGGPREFFTDAALFQTVKTDSNGLVSTSFKLPDNITSWRVTAQGVSSAMDVGLSVSKVPVSLPAFVDVTIGREYLVGDEPMARLRSFGTAFNNNDKINMSLVAPSLGISTPQSKETTAFRSEYFSLPNLSLGTYDVIYSFDSAKGKDSVKLPLTVVSSLLTAQATEAQEAKEGLVLENKSTIPLAVIFSDRQRSTAYKALTSLSWVGGARIDQGLARTMSQEILAEKFAWHKYDSEFSAFQYQMPSGGLTLLPYSSEDLELSARVAALHAKGFDNISLTNYFFKKLEDRKSTPEEVTLALYGLSSLGEPILPRLDSWAKREDLKPKERLYLALAYYNVGSSEKARDIYLEIMKQYGQVKDPHIVIKVSDNEDEVLTATTLTAVLAAYLNESQQYGMISFLRYYRPNDILLYLEELNYAIASVRNLNDNNKNVSYSLNNKETKAELKAPRFSYALEIPAGQSLKVLQTDKDIMLTNSQTVPISLSGIKVDNDITLRREYFVDNKKVNTFKENDIVEIRLYPDFKASALNGSYQITDVLPGGLLPANKIYTGQKSNDCHYYYPYYLEGQKVKFIISKEWKKSVCSDYIKYFARVKTKGVYKAEPAIMQSMLNSNYLNFSTEEKVRIE